MDEVAVKLEAIDSYAQWQRDEGVPVIGGLFVQNLNTMELGRWDRKGGRGAILNLAGTAGLNDMHVVEIAPGKESAPERHMYEEIAYVLSGSGTTSVWLDDNSPKQTFEWGTGSLFAIPLNARFQHFNVSGTQPARYAAVTNAPLVMRLFHSRAFVFDNPFRFTDRFSADDDHFKKGQLVSIRNPLIQHQTTMSRTWQTNFVPDLRALQLRKWKERGGGGSAVGISLGENALGGHIAQFEPSMYKLAHRHGPGAHVIILDGGGYALLWKQGDATRTRCDFQPGTLVVPGGEVWHQWFNTGRGPATYMGLGYGGARYRKFDDMLSDPEMTEVSIKHGGNQIEYDDEDPAVHKEFEAELAKHGARCRMAGLVVGCTGEALTAASR